MENEILQNKTWADSGAGIGALAMTVAAWGVSKVWVGLIETVGRKRQGKKDVRLFGFIGMGSTEAIALDILVIAILMSI